MGDARTLLQSEDGASQITKYKNIFPNTEHNKTSHYKYCTGHSSPDT